MNVPRRHFRRNAAEGYYNLRHKPSQGKDNMYMHNAANINSVNGAEPSKTNYDPTKFAYTNFIFNNDYWEWKMRAGDYLYQIGQNLGRSNDGWTRCLLGYSAFSFMMASQAMIWKIHFAAATLALLSRVRDKGMEPTVDEVNVLDQFFANEKLNALFKVESYHVIDFDQDWEAGHSNPYFPEYKTNVAKFFNSDMNTTVGSYKIGDLDSGATCTLHFKTMPYSNNKYNFTEPFYIYDMWAEVCHNGNYFTEELVKAEDTLKTKRPFVVWH